MLLVGMRAIGADDDTAWSTVTKIGFDSMPALRRQVLELLVQDRGELQTSAIAAALDVPTQTARRTLEDLTAHRVLKRLTNGDGKAHSWRAADWTCEQCQIATAKPVSGANAPDSKPKIENGEQREYLRRERDRLTRERIAPGDPNLFADEGAS
jgi:hypothetical protein